ncbi:MAG TPA: Tat pathway signal protein, partial [Verrucomicrobiota bacterium]|nr:Tat pathway signal protein [Verrucomicrobiota bacterium]
MKSGLLSATGLALAGTLFFTVSIPVAGQENAGTDSAPTGVNLAVVAKATASNVSGDTSLAALNDGFTPRNSRDRRQGTYGNWPSRGTQWVQYEWSQPISTRQIDVYWWDDRSGVRLPAASRLLYWNGTEMVPVKNASGLGVAGDQFNTTTFDEIQTTRLRLEFDGDGDFSTGIIEWRVYDSGKSPDFPPAVVAGIDRVVMLGGKTYLNGAVRSLKPDSPTAKLAWVAAESSRNLGR